VVNNQTTPNDISSPVEDHTNTYNKINIENFLCNCNELIYDYERGEKICSNCGHVIGKFYSHTHMGNESFNIYQRHAGDLSKYSKFDKGLSTYFKFEKKHNTKCSNYAIPLKMKKLSNYDYKLKVQDSVYRNLNLAMKEIDRLSSLLCIPSHVKENAAIIYRKTLKKKLIKGRSIDAFVAASIYIACRLHKVPRSLKIISKYSTYNSAKIGKAYKIIVNNFDLNPPRLEPVDHISKILSTLRLGSDIELQIIQTLEKAYEERLVAGKNPAGVIAAATYLVCQNNNIKITQKHVAKAANSSEVTMRKRVKEFKQIFGCS